MKAVIDLFRDAPRTMWASIGACLVVIGTAILSRNVGGTLVCFGSLIILVAVISFADFRD